jgi:hypothetical protein
MIELIEALILLIIIVITIILIVVGISVLSTDLKNGIWTLLWAAGLVYFIIYWIFDVKFFSMGLHTAVTAGTGFFSALKSKPTTIKIIRRKK